MTTELSTTAHKSHHEKEIVKRQSFVITVNRDGTSTSMFNLAPLTMRLFNQLVLPIVSNIIRAVTGFDISALFG